LVDHQNDDGGWGDTSKSLSNISTTMLAHAVFHATGQNETHRTVVESATAYLDRAGGVQALLARYGKDKTFSIPILTHCALAGVVDWSDVRPLPFELACLPLRFYKSVRLSVVSYALPALIAIGQVRHHYRKPRNPILRLMRNLAVRPSLQTLERIQPVNGGFLEAAPLTSFVTMSLAGMGMSNHPVAKRGVRFLLDSVRDDGSWPIDTNLATWVTTLSVNALQDDLPQADRSAVREWLLAQQYRERHASTNAAPGGWAWTDLPGGVPDVDDTSGVILALLNLRPLCPPLCEGGALFPPPYEGETLSSPPCEGGARGGSSEQPRNTTPTIDDSERQALLNGVRWLLDLQNRDRGWPTFCRGWGALPFDRSAPDLSAHAMRALLAWLSHPASRCSGKQLLRRAERAVQTGFKYLAATQRDDGSWLPLWFGNQFARDDENPTYGTSRVLAVYRDAGQLDTRPATRGLQWLRDAQNADGGWGGAAGIAPSVEETALAVEILLSVDSVSDSARSGLKWLMDRVDEGTFAETTPIGFYFAKLWYFEKLYPQVFMVAALRLPEKSESCSRTDDRPS
jgi:squalene-hopene/tetraprenyl-beta-curcumene cyclase